MRAWLDTSDELRVIRFANGIKLVKPENMNTYSVRNGYNTGYSVGDLLKLQLPIYFLNTQSQHQRSNLAHLQLCNADSEKYTRGKDAHCFMISQDANQLISNDNRIFASNSYQIIDEKGHRLDGHVINAISLKLPWYEDSHKAIGIIGCSIILGVNSVSESMMQIAKLGLLNTPQQFSQTFNTGTFTADIYLSKRETEVLQYAIKGYSANKTSKLLFISRRTVEYHLQNIKDKMNVKSKAEMIDKTLKLFTDSNNSDN